MIRTALDEAIASNLGTIMTVGGSIVVAFIATMGAVWAKRARPGSEPVPIQDVWEENRLLLSDAKTARNENRRLERKVDEAIAAVDVLWRYVQRIRVVWPDETPLPELSPRDKDIVARVIEDVTTPPAGIPAVSV